VSFKQHGLQVPVGRVQNIEEEFVNNTKCGPNRDQLGSRQPKGIQHCCITRETLQEQQAVFSRNCGQELAKVQAEQTETHADISNALVEEVYERGREEKKEGGRTDRVTEFIHSWWG
jgi:hypothetical protein